MSGILRRKAIAICLLLVTVSSAGHAQTATLSAEIRPRTEFRNGFKSPIQAGEGPAVFTEQRSRIHLGFQQDRLSLQLSAQDVRIWGNTNQIYKTDPSLFNMFEAWGSYSLSPHLNIKIGRQALDYDNARFLGDLDWAQQGRSHDALLLAYEDTLGYKIHLGTGFNQQVAFEPGHLSGNYYSLEGNYKAMQFVWLHKAYGSGRMSFLFLNDGRQNIASAPPQSHVNFRQTYGFYGEKHTGFMDYTGELYYQGGKDPSGKTTSAWLLAAALTLKTWSVPLTLGADYLTGTAPGAETNRSFDPLYGTNHKFYGLMDLFYVGSPHSQAGLSAGLQNYYVKSNISLSSKSSLLVHLHHFGSAVAVYEPDDAHRQMGSDLGQEIDLVFVSKISPEINFNLGYSHLFASRSLEVLKGKANLGTVQNWAWAMISFRPSVKLDNLK